eukprot:365303-Chlamydomonas_euryale.AAC.61
MQATMRPYKPPCAHASHHAPLQATMRPCKPPCAHASHHAPKDTQFPPPTATLRTSSLSPKGHAPRLPTPSAAHLVPQPQALRTYPHPQPYAAGTSLFSLKRRIPRPLALRGAPCPHARVARTLPSSTEGRALPPCPSGAHLALQPLAARHSERR